MSKIITYSLISGLLFNANAAINIRSRGTLILKMSELTSLEKTPPLSISIPHRFLKQNSDSQSIEYFLYIFYAKGYPAGLGNKDVTLKKIKKAIKFSLNSSTIEVPSQLLINEPGILNSYDLLVFVISPFDNFYWKNTNLSPVEYSPESSEVELENSGVHTYIQIDYIQKESIDFIKNENGMENEAPIPITLH